MNESLWTLTAEEVQRHVDSVLRDPAYLGFGNISDTDDGEVAQYVTLHVLDRWHQMKHVQAAVEEAAATVAGTCDAGSPSSGSSSKHTPAFF